MIKTLVAGIGLLAGMSVASAQSAPDWLRDLPSVEDVQQRIRGADAAQTLGRQCAALTRLERGNDLPAAWKFNPTPAMAALAERYRDGLRSLQQRYDETVKPLREAANRSEWERMCGNRRSGVHPLSGEPDRNFPALDEPLGEAEFAALLRPAALAAYEAERSARAQRGAQMDQQREAAMAASQRRDMQALRRVSTTAAWMIALPVAGVALLLWMLRSLGRIHWRPGPGDGQLQLKSAIWAVQVRGGLVQACDRRIQTIIDEWRTRNDNGPDTVQQRAREVVHWDIRYADADGRPHDLKLHGWDISVQPGDVLQVFSLQRGRKGSGTVLVANRTTGQSWRDTAFIHGRLVPLTGPLALVLVIICGFLTAGIGWLVGLWWMRRAMKKSTARANDVVEWLQGTAAWAPAERLVREAGPS